MGYRALGSAPDEPAGIMTYKKLIRRCLNLRKGVGLVPGKGLHQIISITGLGVKNNIKNERFGVSRGNNIDQLAVVSVGPLVIITQGDHRILLNINNHHIIDGGLFRIARPGAHAGIIRLIFITVQQICQDRSLSAGAQVNKKGNEHTKSQPRNHAFLSIGHC